MLLLLNAIKQKQLEQNLSDREFALLLGMTVGGWRMVRKGQRNLGGNTLLLALQAFPDLIINLARGKPDFFDKVGYGIAACPLCHQGLDPKWYHKQNCAKGGRASKGGVVTATRYGPEHFKKIGATGGRGNKKSATAKADVK